MSFYSSLGVQNRTEGGCGGVGVGTEKQFRGWSKKRYLLRILLVVSHSWFSILLWMAMAFPKHLLFESKMKTRGFGVYNAVCTD